MLIPPQATGVHRGYIKPVLLCTFPKKNSLYYETLLSGRKPRQQQLVNLLPIVHKGNILTNVSRRYTEYLSSHQK